MGLSRSPSRHTSIIRYIRSGTSGPISASRTLSIFNTYRTGVGSIDLTDVQPMTGWIESKLEGWLGLEINREKTRVVNLKEEGASLDFLGFTFRYYDELKGRLLRAGQRFGLVRL